MEFQFALLYLNFPMLVSKWCTDPK